MRKPFFLCALLSCLLYILQESSLRDVGALAAEGPAQVAERASFFRFGRQSLGFGAGYGFPLLLNANRIDDVDDVRFLYLGPRWGIGLTDPVGGNVWYRGNFELVIEGTFLYAFEPKHGVAGGVTPLVRFNFLAGDRLIPFVQAGAGILALDFDVKGQADGFNFTPQGGLGFHYFVSEHAALTAEWRYHHISNAGIRRPNLGLDTSLFLLSITVFLK